MAGIVSYGGYVPRYRLSNETLGAAWGQRLPPGCRAVAHADEDSLTLAAEAGLDALLMREGRDHGLKESIGSLIFASTTSPYLEKQASTMIAWVCDLARDVRTFDITNSLRAGTQAIQSALDSVAAGSVKSALVTVADMRNAPPRSQAEASMGDGAGALIVGKEAVLAEVLSTYSVSDEITDSWRGSSEPFAQSWEERFAQTQGYQTVVPEAIGRALQESGLDAGAITTVVGSGPDPRSLAAAVGRAGVDPARLADHLFASIGNTGSAQPVMVLSRVLEEARPGDRILLFSYGNGADVLILEVTPEIEAYRKSRQRGIGYYLRRSTPMTSYEQFIKFRELIPTDAARRDPPSASAVQTWRDRDSIYRLHGMRCQECDTLQYPPERVCYRCKAVDRGEPVRFADRRASLFTFTLDYLNSDIDPPSVMSVIDFERGGRMFCMMTDRDPDKVAIGMPLEMTFRKIYKASGFNNYFWKCRPAPEE